MTEQEARRMALKHHDATHVGWLLACVAPTNNTKGERLLAKLNASDQSIAEQYRDYCLELYEKEN